MAILNAARSSSISSVSMEYVQYQPEYNPEALMNYYSCGVHIGRIKNEDVKDKISRAKNHLSALGWKFFYVSKRLGRRELRYRSPLGRTYCSLRSACQVVIDKTEDKMSKKKNEFSIGKRLKKSVFSHDHDLDSLGFTEVDKKLAIKDDFPSDNRTNKRIYDHNLEAKLVNNDSFSNDDGSKKRVCNDDLDLGSLEIEGFIKDEPKLVESYDLDLGSFKIEGSIEDEIGMELEKAFSIVDWDENRIFDHDLDLGSFKIDGFIEKETNLGKNDEFSSDIRPEKRIRIEEVESVYLTQQIGESNTDLGRVETGKKLKDIKNFMKVGKVRKVKASSARRRCVLSVLIEKNIVIRGSRVCYRKKDGKVIGKGRVYDEGIECDCCGVFFLLSKFEAHAGSTYHRPAEFLFLEDGRSLCDCQTQLKLETDLIEAPKSPQLCDRVTGHDEFCWFCKDGGELLLCDSCTSSFHPTCVGLNGVPDSGYWFCPSCACRLCYNQGGISTKSNLDYEQIKCGQCEHKFHIECIRKLGFSLSADSTNWFCTDKCEQIHTDLMEISGKSIPLSIDNLSWRLLKLDYEKDLSEFTDVYGKLNMALNLMHECFQPLKHPWSENDVIEDVIFSRASKRLNFSGFYTAVLEKGEGEEMVTVVNMRVHGRKVAEIPLVATRFRYRRLGLCRILMDELERKLGELGVERLVLPAVPEMVNTWVESFGFSLMTEAQRLDVVDCKFLEFPGTIKCCKILKKL